MEGCNTGVLRVSGVQGLGIQAAGELSVVSQSCEVGD